MLKKYRLQILILVASMPYLAVKAFGGGDFRILLTGAGYLRNGISPYGITMAIPGGTVDVFLYSPFVAFITLPLTYLPEFIPIFGFLIINVLMLFRVWNIMVEWLNIKALSPVLQRWWLALTLLFVIRFILHNFEKTQMNIVVLYLSLEGVWQIFVKEKIKGSFLLALGICLKVLPIVFIPYLIYKKKITEAFTTCLICMILLLIPALGFGFHFNNELLSGWWGAINPTLDKYNSQQNAALYNGVYFHCISSLIPVYFSKISYNGLSVNIANLTPVELFWLINLLRTALVLFTLYFLIKSKSAKYGEVKLYFFWEVSYIIFITPLIFPHQQKYSYINILPAFSFLIYYLLSIYSADNVRIRNERNVLIAILAFALVFTLFTNDLFWGQETGRVFQFLKLIIIGVIPIIPALAYFSPKNIYGFTSESDYING